MCLHHIKYLWTALNEINEQEMRHAHVFHADLIIRLQVAAKRNIPYIEHLCARSEISKPLTALRD